MKKKLKEQFLPSTYNQTLYKNLYNLRQYGTVEEYIEAFYELFTRLDLTEIEEQMVVRYISELKLPIQDVLCLQPLWSVSQAYSQALLVDKQLNRSISRPGNQFHSGLRSSLQFPNFSKACISSNNGHYRL